MPNYKKMYSKLFIEVNDTIDRLKAKLLEMEEIYVSEEKPAVKAIKRGTKTGGADKDC